MVIKCASKLSYFIIEGCYSSQIIATNITPSHFEFSTKEHTFIFDGKEPIHKSEGYDVIELDFAEVLQFTSTKDGIATMWSKLDHSKKYFLVWHFGEGMTQAANNFRFLMDNGVKLYTSTWEPMLKDHPNYIYDLAFSLHYFNYYNGACYTDRTDKERIHFDKKYKVGLYGLTKWKERDGSAFRNWRYDYIEFFENKSDTKILSYERPSIFELSQYMRNQHFSAPFDFRNCNYFLTAESHFNAKDGLPYFTSEKILKSAWLELFDINAILITSPEHMKDLHDRGFWFANSKFIKEYTQKGILDSVYECYESNEIIQTNNFDVMDGILSENLFEKYNII
jgi:hypothetical protein